MRRNVQVKIFDHERAEEKRHDSKSEYKSNHRKHQETIHSSPGLLLSHKLLCAFFSSYLVHVDGREHVLKHGSHQLDMHALQPKVIQHQQWVVSELLLVHPVPL